MTKKHIKTLTVPKTWPIKKKGQKFVIRPLPGKDFTLSMPLSLIFKDLLKYCKTSNEVKATLRDKEILVDGKRKRNLKDLVGFMDVLSIPVSNEEYRMHINKNKKLQLLSIPNEEASSKVCKIIGKTTLKKGKHQLNLFDGKNILVKEDKYKIGESVHIKLPSQEIIEVFKFEKGSYVYIITGKHAGEHGTIIEIKDKQVFVKTKNGEFETPQSSVFMIGKEKPAIKMID